MQTLFLISKAALPANGRATDDGYPERAASGTAEPMLPATNTLMRNRAQRTGCASLLLRNQIMVLDRFPSDQIRKWSFPMCDVHTAVIA